MIRQPSKNRIYIKLFLITLLIVIPYFIGGLSGIVVVLIFAVPFTVVALVVNQVENLSPTRKLFLIALITIIILVAVSVVFLVLAAQNGLWLPIAD